MANSQYEYVKKFELNDCLLPSCWIVIRIDGRAFTRFSRAHGFEKPNDDRGLRLMNACAQAVMEDNSDIVFAYGCSDEFSFILRNTSTLYGRRASKLISVVVSLFVATYVMRWSDFLPDVRLQYAPAFDGRAVCYPSDKILRDYLSWRQVDCHINNQYNTSFWAIVKSGKSTEEAQNTLKGTLADFKNELLWHEFGINYNALPQMFRKGSCLFREKVEAVVKHTEEGKPVVRERVRVVVTHEDIIQDAFWNAHPQILAC